MKTSKQRQRELRPSNTYSDHYRAETNVHRLLLAACLILIVIGDRAFPASILIPVPDRVEHVYDPTRNLLYITTTGGFLQRWDVQNAALLPPFIGVGSSLTGIDITTNGQFAYIGDGTAGVSNGFVRKVNLSTGVRTNITYPLSSLERGVTAVAIASNNRAIFTTDFAGS